MANLVQLANDLEFVPKQQLIQMSQDPNSQYPSFLVLSEIQRRTQMEKSYAAQQPKPQTSVAEELVAEFSNSPSGLGAMAQSSDLQQAFPSGDMSNMAPPSPMQMMASGGRTGYQVGGMSEQEMLKNQFLQSQGFTSTLPTAMQEQQQLSRENLKEIGVLNQDGSVNKGNLAKAIGSGLLTAAAVAAILAPEPTTTALGAARLGLTGLPSKIGSGIKSGYQSGLRKIGERKMGKVASAPIVSQMNPKTLEGIGGKAIKDLKLPTRILGGGAGLFGLSRIFGGSDEEEIKPSEVPNQNESSQEQVLQDEITGDVNADKGLGQRFKDFAKSSRGADMLIGLGGAIASARNLGELGSGISDAYRGVIADRAAAKQAGLQEKLLEAQIANIEANIGGMELKELQSSASIIQEGMETGTLDRTEYTPTLQAIIARIELLQNLQATGLNLNNDIYGKTGANITGG